MFWLTDGKKTYVGYPTSHYVAKMGELAMKLGWNPNDPGKPAGFKVVGCDLARLGSTNS